MRAFECICGNPLYFENTLCTKCNRAVGWCPGCDTIAPLEPAADAWVCARPQCGAALAQCHNYAVEHVCNRMLLRRDTSGGTLCDCCCHTEVIPDLSIPGHRQRWARLEEAKRRLIYQLDRLGLPRLGLDPPLRFHFKADSLPTGRPGHWRPMGGEQVVTGHEGGRITIDVQEADDAERMRLQIEMGEDYRTLLGHFRHECGHYYWDLLIDSDWARRARFVELFGDPDHPSYSESLDRHYRQGPPSDWSARFTTAYASMHPWEDWAETWAAYLELLSTLDTAVHLGLGRGGTTPYADQAAHVEALLPRYQELGIDLNEMNRAMGLSDVLTRTFSPPVVAKLAFVDEVVRASRT